jgi:Flp pilus assembly protein TadD
LTAREFKEKANNAFKEGNFAEALSLYDEAIDICPPEEK